MLPKEVLPPMTDPATELFILSCGLILTTLWGAFGLAWMFRVGRWSP